MKRDEVLAEVHKMAGALLESGGECPPVLLIEDQDGDWVLCDIQMTDKLKRVWSTILPLLLREVCAKGYIMATEAWMASFPKGTEPPEELTKGKIKISDLPPDDRQEILFVVSVVKGKSVSVLTSPIRNAPSGKSLGDLTALSQEEVEGRLLVKDW